MATGTGPALVGVLATGVPGITGGTDAGLLGSSGAYLPRMADHA